ncbi:MAG TPA: c-type cytochrome [Gemmata sp.]
MTFLREHAARGRVSRFLLVALGAIGIAVGAGWAVGKLRPARPAPSPAAPTVEPAPGSDPQRGELVFAVYCASCHGPDGHGDGSAAAMLRPPPRDFAARPWRFAPTPEAIRKVTRDGIPGTAMASFRTLPPADLDAVVAHVERLATAGPVTEKPPSEDARLLAAAGFTDLTGTVPPPLVLTDARDRLTRLPDLKGKLVVLHFWGTGCTHCVKEIPTLDRLGREHAGQLVVLHVCADADTPADAQKVLDKLAPGAVAHVEATGLGVARYEVQALPTVWLIAPDGSAIGRSSGAKDWTAEPQTRLLAQWFPPAK